MSLEKLLHFRNLDSTENLNARLAGLIPKGIVKGGIVVPEPTSLQIRIKGDGVSPFILLAFAYDGMVIREKNEEHVLPVEAGITSVVVLRAKYVESLGGSVAQFEVIPLGSYQNDPDPNSLIRLCSVTIPAGATAVLSEHINMGFRDSIEGFTRRIVRDVVGTKEDLPSVSGFPAIAEINFLSNNFVLGTTVSVGTGAGTVLFPIVQPVNFRVAGPSVPGLSRVHPTQKEILAATQSPLSGLVTVVTTTPHGFTSGQSIRISGNSASQANQLWVLEDPPTSVDFVVSPAPTSSMFTVFDLVDNIFELNSHGFTAGLKIQVSSTDTLPTGLSPLTNYYVVPDTDDTFKLSDTLEHAIAGTDIIEISDVGIGDHTLTTVVNVLTSNSHGFSTGLKVKLTTTGVLPVGLSTGTDYYLVVLDGNTFKLSDTLEHAVAGTDIIDMTDIGSGTHSCLPQADNAFFFNATLTLPWSGTGGVVVDTTTNATVVARMAPGVLHSLVSGNNFTLTGTTDRTFEGTFEVISVIDAQTIMYNQAGYPTADSGNGNIYKEGGFLPTNAVEMGESATGTALNFEDAFNASPLSPDITAMAIGSSIQFMATVSGVIGNSYTLEKDEPSVAPEDEIIVLSGSTFSGGVDPNPSATTNVDLSAGDLYVVMFGSTGTMEIWGYDGIIFRNLTSATTATLLEFHRRNQFLNEKHVTENEKAALAGSVGVPSSTNRYLTQQDTSTLTTDIAAALTGADNDPPDGDNRYLTEARVRGERGEIEIPLGQDYVEVPLTDGSLKWSLVVGKDNVGTDSSLAILYFNLVFTSSLYDRGGPTEYSQTDFSSVTIDKIYVTRLSDPLPPPFLTELNPSSVVSTEGIFPRSDAINLPTRLWIKLNQTPDNGSATLLFSKVITERYRHPAADMFATPQRILPAQVQDLINRTKELRFNAGISISGTTIEFPENLFSASNIQNYKLKRFVGSRLAEVTDTFSIDFETGGVTGDVDPVTLEIFTGSTLNKYTKYLLALTPQGRIQVRHISLLLERATDIAYATDAVSISNPSLPFSDGSYVFAAVYVKSDGTDGTSNIENLIAEDIELYPYQNTNSKDYATSIVCGDGVSSFGHFTGEDAHIRALAFAPEGSTIKLGMGTYNGTLLVSKNNITFDGSAGATITAVTATAIIVVGNHFCAKHISFDNCDVAIDLQGGADDVCLRGLGFGSGVITRIKSPSIYPFTVEINPDNKLVVGAHSLVAGAQGMLTTSGSLPSGLSTGVVYYVINPEATKIQLSTSPNGTPVAITSVGTGSFGTGEIYNLEAKSAFNRWVVSDGTNIYGVGDFNGPNGIQQAHDVATAGDEIQILAGIYSKIQVSKDRLSFKGIGGGEVRINGAAGVDPCIAVTGSYNQFDNITLENSSVGIDCQLGSTFNTFSPTVVCSSDIQIFVKMPQTDTIKHYNYHPLVCGRVTSGLGALQQNTEVTVGDGNNSWGDYVGSDAINVAIIEEGEGTKIKVGAGSYNPINLGQDGSPLDNLSVEGSGVASVIRANALIHEACITVVGSGNNVSGFHLLAENNESEGLDTLGIKVTGNDNTLSNIKFQLTGDDRIEPHKKYLITSGYRNVLVPHTGAPTTYVSWTVGDGIHSFGDFNGGGGITAAISALPTKPNGTQGVLTSFGATATFSDSGHTFGIRDLYRYLCIQAGANAGTYRIIACNPPYDEVTIERVDGIAFTNETGIYWYFTSGAKLWVLPGQYEIFSIPNYRSDIEIEAWGSGSDTMIVGDLTDTTLLQIDGSRCRIKGFRFVGGDPVTCSAITVNGSNNTFEANRYDTATRYVFGSNATGNHIYDAPEALDRTYLTVSTSVSRGDYVGNDEIAIQAALDAASNDPHINRVILGKGTWVLANTINVPANITLEGSGYDTELSGNGLIDALTLSVGGRQTIKGIRFNNFSNSLIGPASNVFAYGNWLESAPINGNVTGSTTMNI